MVPHRSGRAFERPVTFDNEPTEILWNFMPTISFLLEDHNHVQTLGGQVIALPVAKGSVAFDIYFDVADAIPLSKHSSYFVEGRRVGNSSPQRIAELKYCTIEFPHVNFEEEYLIADI